MIYYLDRFVDWKTPQTADEHEVAKGIADIKEKYFKHKNSSVELRYENGKPKRNATGAYEMPRYFMIDCEGGNGEWRYTKTRPTQGRNGLNYFSDLKLSYKLDLKEEDVELVWFLMTKNNQVKNGNIRFVDHDAEAKQENDKIASDIDLQYHLFGGQSAIATDEGLLREIAIAFNIENAETLGVQPIKNRLYHEIKKGNQTKNRFINTERFLELAGNDEVRATTKVVINAVRNKDFEFSTKDFNWHYVEGEGLGDAFLPISGKEANNAVNLLINECIKNEDFKKTLYAYLGLREETQLELYRKMTKEKLIAKCKELNLPLKQNINKEELIKLLCETQGIEYLPL